MEKMNFSDFLTEWNITQNLTTPDIHLELALWLEQRWSSKDTRFLVMAFRGFGKSTIVGVFCTWALWRNPDLRILVLAADLALARKMVRQVKRIIEKHPKTKQLKPAKAEEWSGDRFTIVRPSELRDPSMLAKGIDANLTGSRAELVICDDVEVPRTSGTAYKREGLRERLLELEYILTPDGSLMYIGTPHHKDTIYAEEKEAKEDEVFLHGYERIVMPVMDEEGNSVWPERFSNEKLNKILAKTGNKKFSSQMLCSPINLSEGKLDATLLQVYHDELEYTESAQQPVLKIGNVRMESAIAWWDPAFGGVKGDRSVLAVVYKGEDQRHYIHEIKQIFIKKDSVESEMDQQCHEVARILKKCYVPKIVIEKNGIGQFLPGHLRRHLKQDNIQCLIEEIHSQLPKHVRILSGFEVQLAAKNLHAHRRAAANSLVKQLEDWDPEKKNQPDDVLDAVAGAIIMQKVKFPLSGFIGRPDWLTKNSVTVAKTVLD